MDLRIIPGKLSGPVTPPPSKSMAHRVLLAAMLAHSGKNDLPAEALSQDIQATCRCIDALNTVRPGQLPHLDCGESGSTLRFLIPIALAVADGGIFTGQGRLMERPQQPYFDIFDEKGISYDLQGGILTVRGHLEPGIYSLPGNISSQFVTGLLYALPLLEGNSELRITTPLESGGYVDMTLHTLEQFGIQIKNRAYEQFFISGHQVYQPQKIEIEADWSQAAFWYAACSLGSTLDIRGLNAYSSQGDMIVVPYYLRLSQPGDVEIDLSGCPDLLPPLAVMAAVRQGVTRFVNAARLRIKESDRLSTVCQLLTALGGQVEEGRDSLTVYGVPHLSGGTVNGANDHRIVMAAAIAATACLAPVTILGAEAVQKSYPHFWEEYQRLGGMIHVL